MCDRATTAGSRGRRDRWEVLLAKARDIDPGPRDTETDGQHLKAPKSGGLRIRIA